METIQNITIEEAAEMLFVSVEFVYKLLKDDTLSHREVNGQQLILLDELVEHQRKMKQNREKQLSFLAREAQELGLGY